MIISSNNINIIINNININIINTNINNNIILIIAMIKIMMMMMTQVFRDNRKSNRDLIKS